MKFKLRYIKSITEKFYQSGYEQLSVSVISIIAIQDCVIK